MQAKRMVIVTVIVMMAISGTVFAEGLDVTVRAPTIIVYGQTIPTTDLQSELNNLKTELETDPDLQNFANQEDLARAFANAGAASTHMATQRSFSDYRLFALVLGTGAAIAAPSPRAAALEDSLTDFEDDGDAYFGAAIQPLTVSLGVNLSRWVDRLRVNAKFGYFNVAEGTVVDNISFRSTTIGIGADYQIIESRSLPLGIIRWRGVSLGSGINYQSNTTDLSVEVRDAAFSEKATFSDLGLTAPPGYTGASEVGSLTVSPTISATVTSSSVSIPLEASTGIRLLYLLDFNIGAGVDLALGNSEVAFGAESEVDFVAADSDIAQELSVTPGSVDLGVSTESKPQFIRPRVTAGVGLNLGPVKVDVPLMYYFDTDGPTAMVGVNLGIVW